MSTPIQDMASSQTAQVDLFKSIGLPQAKAQEAAKSAKSATILKDLIEQHSLVGTLDEKQAVLVASLSGQLAKSPNATDEGKGYVVTAIRDGRLKSVDQVAGMSANLQHRPNMFKPV